MGFPVIERGKRLVIAGRTGSGKSTLGRWFLARSPGHWVVLNPKHTKAYDGLPDSKVLSGINYSEIEKSILKNRITIINPGALGDSPENLDDILTWLHENYTNVGVCADELYTLHNNGKAGSGLIGWLTRGRELGQSFLGMTQRPAWVSKFLLSESDYLVSMSLAIKDDRKKMVDATGREEMMAKIIEHHWLFYEASKDNLTYYGPVPRNS